MYVLCLRETNLKVKQPLTATAAMGNDSGQLSEFDGKEKQTEHCHCWPAVFT